MESVLSAIKSDNAIETDTPQTFRQLCVCVKAKKTEETEVSQGRDNRWEFWRERGRWRLRDVWGVGGRRDAVVSQLRRNARTRISLHRVDSDAHAILCDVTLSFLWQ